MNYFLTPAVCLVVLWTAGVGHIHWIPAALLVAGLIGYTLQGRSA